MPKPAPFDIEHYRGDTLRLLVRCWSDTAHQIPTDLTGASVAAQVKLRAGDIEVVAAFDTAIGIPTGGTVANQVTLVLDGDTQREMPTKTVWDMQIDKTGDSQTPLAGTLVLTDDVTQTMLDDGS